MADFSLYPDWVQIHEPEFHTIESPDTSLKKNYETVTPNYLQKFTLIFKGISDVNAKIIWDHYVGQKGSYESFDWKNAYIPAYVLTQLGLTVDDITMNWVEGSYKTTFIANGLDVEISAERIKLVM